MHNKHTLYDLATNSSFDLFLQKSFSIVSPSSEFINNWHLELIADKLNQIQEGRINRLIINIPPRYLKSICVSVAWPAWLLGINPSTKIMAASYSQTLSNKHSQDCRLIMSSNWYKKIFPSTKIVRGENQKFKFVTSKRGYRFATSTGGTATGEGGDILIIDDPQNPNKINSKKYREKTIEWFEQTFISRLNDKNNGAIVIIMQRLHDDDLCGYLLKNKSEHWDLLKLPVIFDSYNNYSYTKSIPFNETYLYENLPHSKIEVEIQPSAVLHPAREDEIIIDKIRAEMGEYIFNSQYLQSPLPSQGNMVKKSWIKYFDIRDNIEFNLILQSWDTAIKAKDESDYSVCITLGTSNNNYYILDVYRGKLEFPELVNMLQQKSSEWKPQVVLIEDAASGQSLIQTLSSKVKFPMIPIQPQYDKVTRFARHSALFEAGKILIERMSKWKVKFEEELLGFPKTSNDDQIDSLSQALNYLEERRNIQIKRL